MSAFPESGRSDDGICSSLRGRFRPEAAVLALGSCCGLTEIIECTIGVCALGLRWHSKQCSLCPACTGAHPVEGSQEKPLFDNRKRNCPRRDWVQHCSTSGRPQPVLNLLLSFRGRSASRRRVVSLRQRGARNQNRMTRMLRKTRFLAGRCAESFGVVTVWHIPIGSIIFN